MLPKLFPALLVLAFAEAKIWKVPENVDDTSEIAGLQCADKCANSTTCAVIENGVCYCDECHRKSVASLYMTVSNAVVSNSAMFIPYTHAANNFESIGFADVTVIAHGVPMSFTEDGPEDPSKKVMRLASSGQKWIDYTLPDSLLSAAESEGVIITFWLKFANNVTQQCIFEFFRTGYKMHFWQSPAGQYLLRTNENPQVRAPADTNWHYIMIVSKSNTYELRIDGVSKGNATAVPEQYGAVDHTMRVGLRGNVAAADASLYCFVMQMVGTKTDAEITAAGSAAKNACDHF